MSLGLYVKLHCDVTKAEVRIELTMSVLQTNAFNHLATQPYYNNLEIVDSANGN
jgi:hypothetical protein